MILTFKQLGVNKAQYNGVTYGLANACIINIACDYLMDGIFKGCSEQESLRNVELWYTDFLAETVTTLEHSYRTLH